MCLQHASILDRERTEAKVYESKRKIKREEGKRERKGKGGYRDVIIKFNFLDIETD